MAHSYVTSMADGLSCCVCFELFVDPHTPKDLNCPHMICQVCLKRHVKDGAIDCPQCRVITRVPKNGVAALKTNLGIRNLAETHQRHAQQKEKTIQTSSSTIKHGNKVPVCPDHDEKMHFYCTTCHTFVCRACTVTNHKQHQHQIQEVKVLHREQMQQVTATITKLEQDALLCKKTSREISGTKLQILSSIQTEDAKIDQALALLMEKACAESDALKAEIRRTFEPKLKQCQEGETSVQKRAEELQRAVTDARAVMTATSSHDFVIQHKSLMDKLKALPSGPSHDEEQIQYQPGEVEFKAEQVMTLKLGTITIKQGRQPVARKRNTVGLVRKMTKSAELGGFTRAIISIASNRAGDILANSDGTNAVHIYCKQSNGQYKKQSSLNVTGSKFDGSQYCYVTIAPDEGYFIVANDRRIHMYSQSGKYQHVCYTAPEGAKLSCISTMKDGRIIAGNNADDVITLHTPDGMTLMKTINTRIQLVCITAINNTHVAICQCHADKVCVIDLESGDNTLSIDIVNPLSVCYDEETDCLLIACGLHMGQCVIDQYSLLTGDKIACTAENLYYPSAMIFTGDGRLAVKDHKTVKLYQVGFN